MAGSGFDLIGASLWTSYPATMSGVGRGLQTAAEPRGVSISPASRKQGFRTRAALDMPPWPMVGSTPPGIAGERNGRKESGMGRELSMLDVRARREWRAWLARHHASSPGVWLVFHKNHTGVTSIAYEDAVREALCFGWIDSLIKRLDDDRFGRMFTPRKPTSRWSDLNRTRWAELKDAGLLAAAGLAAAPTTNRYAPRPEIPDLPAYVERAFKAHPTAWRCFQGLAPTHRRQFVAWIHMAKRPGTRERRIRESIELLAAGRKLGLK